ncbi:hypothetical protein BRADI_1g15035v3 [Brachypodium distachyon]|uniref:Uncharacterized protein n=1 Tax=Brachypodium distachyon TaxID=15368 RepID=A0A2K2DJK7_BRADI|nr:hypothetical protein BRADI_1g15035v3 [Brachypodium distachyon]
MPCLPASAARTCGWHSRCWVRVWGAGGVVVASNEGVRQEMHVANYSHCLLQHTRKEEKRREGMYIRVGLYC